MGRVEDFLCNIFLFFPNFKSINNILTKIKDRLYINLKQSCKNTVSNFEHDNLRKENVTKQGNIEVVFEK